MQVRGRNIVKEKLKNGKKVSGTWSYSASNIITEILADSGFDFIMIDLEHGPGNILTLIGQIQAMQGYDAVPFVRAPWNDIVQIKRILDTGVYGLLVPYVNNGKEAEMAVKAVKYPPKGVRGIAGCTRAAGYGNKASNYLTAANDEIFLMVAVETREALENIDQILSVEGIDGIFIGPMDLSTNMGYFINPSHEEVQKEIRRIEEKVFSSGKVLGTITSDWEDAENKYNRGYNLLMLMADTLTLGKCARDMVARFKSKYD